MPVASGRGLEPCIVTRQLIRSVQRRKCRSTLYSLIDKAMTNSEDPAATTLLLFAARWEGRRCPSCRRRHLGLFWSLVLVADCHCDGHVEDVLDTILLFTTALHVHGAHFLCDGTALVWRDGCQPLGFEELDAVLLVAEI